MSDYTEKVLSSRDVYKGRIINLRVDTVVLPNGRTSTREIVEHAGAVAIVPVNEKGELLMVRQYRHAVGKILLEIPAGKLEPGEEPEDCAGRELLEETGFEAERLTRLFSLYSSPGFINEKVYLYLATGLKLKGQNLDDDEFVDVVPVPSERVLEMIWTGEICDAKSVNGILAVHNLKNQHAK